jgi:predicted outer membrane repeat protein
VPTGIYVLSIVGTGEDLSMTGDLDITDDVVIEGARGVVIDAGRIDRVFDIWGAATAEIARVSITGGDNVSSGGGIECRFGSSLTLVSSTVRGNTATGGGGISADSASLTLIGSTVSGNSANDGGGFFVSSTPLNLTNSTVSGNTASNGLNGIVNFHSAITLVNSTVSNNSGNGITNSSASATMILTNSLIDDICSNYPSMVITSNGGNLESPGDTCGLTDPSDQPGVQGADLNLGPLADNGGPTETHALLPGSFAIGAALNVICQLTDQRGFPRDIACDVGAYEAGAENIFADGFETGNPMMWSATTP